MINNMNYDETSPESIEDYGKKMIGKTFSEICRMASDDNLIHEESVEYATSHANKKYKGGMGNLVEECWFGYKANSRSSADFEKAGVELKVTPYVRSGKGYRAKERLVLTMINYMKIVEERDFKHSHLWKKMKLILLVWYLHIKNSNDINSIVDYVQLFAPPLEDLAIIRTDYEKIMAKIRAGKAHELSEGDTLYLGACTKAASSKDRRKQPYSNILAKPRAFSFKNSYMTYILTNYIMKGKITYEPIIKSVDQNVDFERYVIDNINKYKGSDIDKLCSTFGVKKSHAKNIASMLVLRILGVTSNQCEEFVKAGIVVKTIRINENGRIKESMSFPPFKFTELVKETWAKSTFGNYLRETRFLFVIFKRENNGKLYLRGCQFWNMPVDDIEGDAHEVWQQTHDIIKEGRLTVYIDKDGRVVNNLPKMRDHFISHVRPHGRDKDDTYSLPEGTCLTIKNGILSGEEYTHYTKQCFWLNNKYILSQINHDLKND